MFDLDTAKRLVLEFINKDFNIPDDELVTIDENTLEKSYGWIFFYTSRKYLETGDIGFLVPGNGPIIFEKDSGKIIQLGTAFPAQRYIEEYEEQRLGTEKLAS